MKFCYKVDFKGQGRKLQNTRSFTGIERNIFFQEISKALEENFKIPGVFQEYREIFFFQEISKALEENFKIPGVFQEFQEFFRNSRNSEHHVLDILLEFLLKFFLPAFFSHSFFLVLVFPPPLLPLTFFLLQLLLIHFHL